MRRFVPYIALMMVYLMTPAMGEITENVVHLFTEGHTAHAMLDQEHEPSGDEHGCSVSFHLCQCHGALCFLPSASVQLDERDRPSVAPIPQPTRQPIPSGHLLGVFRPPIAPLYS